MTATETVCEHCGKAIRRCATPRPCSGQCSSGYGWIHLSGTHGCARRPARWKGTGPYAEPRASGYAGAAELTP